MSSLFAVFTYGARLRELLWVAATALFISLLVPSCKREERSFRVETPQARPPGGIRLSGLEPGLAKAPPHDKSDYDENAPALAEGKHLFSAFNCNGCHANGGGDIGPPLIDRKWTYGSAPEQVFATIAEGRPNGMPAFGEKLTQQQIWQLTAYVRSMSALVPQDAAPGRSDHMKSNPPENSIDPSPPTAPHASGSTEKPE